MQRVVDDGGRAALTGQIRATIDTNGAQRAQRKRNAELNGLSDDIEHAGADIVKVVAADDKNQHLARRLAAAVRLRCGRWRARFLGAAGARESACGGGKIAAEISRRLPACR